MYVPMDVSMCVHGVVQYNTPHNHVSDAIITASALECALDFIVELHRLNEKTSSDRLERSLQS